MIYYKQIVISSSRIMQQVNPESILTRKRFATYASVAIAISFWLSTTTVNSCSSINGTNELAFQCNKEVLGAFLIEHKKWPYHDLPFVGYWDSFDNKLTSFVMEPYSRLFLVGTLVYLVWFRVITYVEKKNISGKKWQPHSPYDF